MDSNRCPLFEQSLLQTVCCLTFSESESRWRRLHSQPHFLENTILNEKNDGSETEKILLDKTDSERSFCRTRRRTSGSPLLYHMELQNYLGKHDSPEFHMKRASY